MLAAGLAGIDGVDCDVATTLHATRELLAGGAQAYFVAVCCLNLPDAPDGEVVDVLLRADLRVIVLTGFVDDGWRARMFELGVADYVVKEGVAGVEYVRRCVERMHANAGTGVLVVDDSRAFREYAGSLLRQHGYQSYSVADGEEALAFLQQHPQVRLVITDYTMPRMDGLALVRAIRQTRSADDLAVMAVSESAQAGVLASFLKSGANDYLRKPFCIEEFYCRVDQNIDMLRAVRDARHLANRDFLTGLYNRRYFFQHAVRQHERARAGEIRLLAAMIDIDHFKRINDRYGHHAGDEALVAVADCLRRLTGGNGLVARIGGEEFAYVSILAADSDPLQCLEGIRTGIAAIALDLDAEPVRLTASIGATLNTADDLDAMLALADEAVYQAKSLGRNRVVLG